MSLVVGDKINLDIRKQGINGEGIGYYNKTLVFVDGAIQKETVACEVVNVERNYANAEIIKIKRHSTKRRTPPCKYYENCGGCQMQHIEYKEQLKIKQNTLKQAIKKYTKIDLSSIDIKKTKGQDPPYYYRNKSQMPFKNTNFDLAIGFYRPGSNAFVYVEDCIVHHKEINKINQKVLSVLRKHKQKAYDSKNRDGKLLYIVTRYLKRTDSASVTLVVKAMTDKLKEIGKEIKKLFPSIKSVSYTVKNPESNLVISDKVHLIAGSMWIEDSFKDIKVKVSPDAFHQLNTKQMELMYDMILEIANVNDKSIVFDLYSGIGITSILLAKSAKKVYGIDFSHASIKDAAENARLNKVENVEFIADHVESAMPKLLKKGIKPNLVLLDPPRRGLAPQVIAALLTALPKEIIYVSCNPSTLAKDLDRLTQKYKVKSISPIDMFPNTASVESITLLELI